MEMFAKLGIDWKILIAQIINFFIILVILRIFLYKPILKMLKTRKEKIEKSLKQAQDIEKEKQNLDKKTQEILKQSKEEASKIIGQARETGRSLEKKIKEQAQKQSREMIAKNQVEIEKAKDNLIDEAKQELAQLVIAANKRLIGQSPSQEPSKADIEKILKEIRAS